MPLVFEIDKTFDENLSEFETHVSALDPEMAAILLRHLDKLKGTGDQARDRARRTEFNRAVLADLEAMVGPRPREEQP